TDPRVVPKARRLDRIAFEDMLELASQGAKVLQVRSVELGMVHNMPVFVRSSFDKPEDINPHANQPPGTLICNEEEIMESHVVTGRYLRRHSGVASQAFSALAARNINIRAITTSEIKFSVLIDAAYTELAVRTLHTLYGLDQA